MNRPTLRRGLPQTLLLLALFAGAAAPISSMAANHDDLVRLFEAWRTFETPPLRDGAPDYTETTSARRAAELPEWQARLGAIDIEGWPIADQVDWHLVRAEMNGMEFNHRVLRPWARDPAFYAQIWTYQSDTPAHEGPTNHALVELWTYEFPLVPEAEEKLTDELGTIPSLLAQARQNLTGNGRELWIAGIKNLRDQAQALRSLQENLEAPGAALTEALVAAIEATEGFVAWLEAESENKDGPSGIGIEDYTWSLRNVHYVPMTWEDEVRLLQRELDRAWSSLKLEEHNNRDLPPLPVIESPDAYEAHAERSVRRLADFLVEGEVLPPYPYIEPVLRAHRGQFVPEDRRNFFWTVVHYEPMVLWTHWYHWFDLARMDAMPHPSPIRRGPLLYNLWDSRSEGLSTGFEEITMRAGLYDDNPRARELVWIMLAQRAARGLGSLYAQANTFTLKEARDFHVAWTPRGWMREDLDLLGFEQLLYLRQPGYGTSYITGKYLMERLMAERAKQLGDDFELQRFFQEVDEAGVIPVSLIRWQLTGQDDEIRDLMERPNG
jgi:hypothetical protein